MVPNLFGQLMTGNYKNRWADGHSFSWKMELIFPQWQSYDSLSLTESAPELLHFGRRANIESEPS
jgi:hypothetical protein